MSTFEENIANLKQNNRFTTQQIKTYNLDEARFESASLQRQGELWMLAGNLGADFVEKIAANREKDAINDEYITHYENKWEEYLGSDEAAAAEKLFKSNANNQNILSDGLVNVESAGGPSDDVAEGRLSTGKHIRIREQLRTADLKQRFIPWVRNQYLNNQDIFIAEIEGKPVKIKVNNPNLTHKEKVASLKYLTKEYLKLHDIQKYSRDFLYLPTERGGSGFMKSILEANQTFTEEFRNAYKIELSEVDINMATRQLATLKDAQSFKDLLSSLNAGYNAKGEQLNYAGAWKRLNDKILPQMIDAGKLGPDEILSIGNKTILTIDGKEKVLGEHRSLEWGENGKWHLKAMEVWKKKGEREQAKADFKLEGAAEEFLTKLKNDTFTSETDKTLGRSVLEDLNKNGSETFDFTEIDEYIESKLTKEQADSRALELVNDFKTKPEGRRLSDLIKTEDIRVRNSSVLLQALKEDKAIWDEVDDAINNMKKNYAAVSKVEGKDVWSFDDVTNYVKWKAVEGYAVRYKKQNPKATVEQVWAATEKWEDNREYETGQPYEQWDSYLAKLKADGNKAEAEAFADGIKKQFAKDSEGKYPNLMPEPKKSVISKEDKKELISYTSKDKTFGNEVTTWGTKKDIAKIKFADSNLIIPEEQAVFKNQEIDYNKMLDEIGYIPDTLVDLAADSDLTTSEFIIARQTANGKKDLKPEYAKFLNEKEISTLPSAMRKRLLGKINDGQYTSEHIPATITQNSNLSSASLINTFQEHGEQFVQGIATNYETFASSLDDDGEWIDNADSGKALIGLYSGIAMSLDSNAINDFQPGGQSLFVETVKANLNEEAISSMLMSPEFGFNAYATSGDSDYLPVVDSLQATKGQDNLNKIMQKLYKIWQTEAPTEETTTTSETFDSDQNVEISGTDIIEESL